MKTIIIRVIILLSLTLTTGIVRAQSTTVAIDDLYVSYIYSAVMGSGNYSINNRQISMFRIPFAYTQRELSNEQSGLKWHAPVTLGYDSLNYPDWLSRIVDDKLAILTLMPGIETMHRANAHWIIKPFANLGGAYDFSRHETILMGIMGIRALGHWTYADHSELRLGSTARYAAEYQLESDHRVGFSLFELGADYRRDIRLKVMDHDTNAGVYYRSQLFLPDWEAGKRANNIETRLILIHEIGASIGLQKPRKVLGISISRVRAGFSFGDHIRGWTIGTEFPF